MFIVDPLSRPARSIQASLACDLPLTCRRCWGEGREPEGSTPAPFASSKSWDAQQLTRVDLVRMAQHRAVSLKNIGVVAGIAEVLFGDLG